MFERDLLWIELDRTALRHNLDVVRRYAGEGVRIAPCVKANAYGHGLAPIAKELAEAGIEWFSVQSVDDASTLRANGIEANVVVMGPVPRAALGEVVRERFRIFLFDLDTARALAAEARAQGTTALVHLEIDTGMSRFGIFPHELCDFLDGLRELPELRLEAVATHFASAGGPLHNAHQEAQALAFAEVRRALSELAPPPFFHAAKSSAMVRYPETRYDLVRPGILLYGSAGGSEMARSLLEDGAALRPVLSLKSRVAQVKTLPVGAPIGYDGTYVAERPTTVAVVPAGYADGVNRLLSNRGQFLIRGRRAPIRGRVCMNVTMVEATGPVEAGDEVVLLGRQGEASVSADDVASLSQTIPYEVFTSLPGWIPRYVVG